MKTISWVLYITLITAQTNDANAHVSSTSKKNIASETAIREKVDALNNTCAKYLESDNFDEALPYAQEAIKLASGTSYQEGLAKANVNLGKIYSERKNEEALTCFQKAREIYDSKGMVRESANILDAIAAYYLKQFNFSASLDYYQQALEIKKRHQFNAETAQTYISIGTLNQNRGSYDLARSNFLNAIEFGKIANDSNLIARGYLGLFTGYDKQGDFKNAITYALMAKKMFHSAGSGWGEATMNYSMGIFNMQIGNYDEALKYYQESVDYWEQIAKKTSLATSLNQMGRVYTFMGDYSSAEKYITQALDIAEKNEMRRLIASCNDHLGINYESKGELDKALNHYSVALKGFRFIKEGFHTSKSLCNIGSILLKEEQFMKAIDTFYRGLIIAKEIKAKENVSRAYKGLATAYFNLSEPDSAYYYLTLYSAVDDSLLDETRAKQLIALQVLYESEHKDNEILRLNLDNKTKQTQLQLIAERQKITELQLKTEQQEKELMSSENERYRQTLLLDENLRKQQEDSIRNLALQNQLSDNMVNSERSKRNYAITGGLGIVSLLSLVFYQFNRRRHTRFSLQINQLNNKILRAQLNPHFIFNALNSIGNYFQQHPELAGNYLTKFSTLMRQVLEYSEEERISLQEEIAMLENYMELESLRLPFGFDYEVILEDSLDADNIMIPPLILQPMVENAIWHGLKPLDHRGKISLRFSERNGLLEAIIEDNGAGHGSTLVNTLNAEKKRSMGMQITRERIKLINRKASSKGWLRQNLFEGGSYAEIAIPVA